MDGFSPSIETSANADIHATTTAAEILSDFDGIDLRFITGYGTGGFVTGARVLREDLDTKIPSN